MESPKTLMYSEGLAGKLPPSAGWGGVMGEIIFGNMGGSLFSAFLTPNSTSADMPIGKCPQDVGDGSYPPPARNSATSPNGSRVQGAYAAARSRHPGGVVASMVDGSAHFFSNSIDPTTWRGIATRAGGEAVSVPE